MIESCSERVSKRKSEVLGKANSCREKFKKKEKDVTADLEEAKRIWNELGEKFRWWQSLP